MLKCDSNISQEISTFDLSEWIILAGIRYPQEMLLPHFNEHIAHSDDPCVSGKNHMRTFGSNQEFPKH